MAHAASRVAGPRRDAPLALHAALVLGIAGLRGAAQTGPPDSLEIRSSPAPRRRRLSRPPPPPRYRSRGSWRALRAKQQELLPLRCRCRERTNLPPPTSEAPRNTPQPCGHRNQRWRALRKGRGGCRRAGNTRRARLSGPRRRPKREALQGGASTPQPRGQRTASAAEPGGAQPAQVLSGASERSGFEGDVVLATPDRRRRHHRQGGRLSDPGQGLARRRHRRCVSCGFSPAKVNGVAVATTVPFTIHFTLD